jgi:hypothetical protein
MRRRRRWPGWGLGLLVVAGLGTGAGAADEVIPLRERIDRAIEAKREGRLAAPATDGEFLRRVALDLAGMIPTAAEARAFLDDPSPYKRERLVDRLLDGPEYARRMQVVFDVMLMERRPDQHVPSAEWQAYLLDAFDRNVPYDRLVREVLSADGADPERRGPAKFYLDRGGDPNLLTRDVGRIFLGRDMQCAQCHDHVLYDDYKQAHYYGLLAFFSRSYLVQDARGLMTFAEKADGDVTFASVFKKKITHKTGPRLIDGPEVPDPAVAKGQEYLAAPGERVRAIPRYSRRAQLPAALTSGRSPEFARNIANRLWALMMGRGLVHPLDLHHGDNPPSHPELLDLLAREFAATGYDVKGFLRELALTRTYGRSSEPPPGSSPEDAEPQHFAVAALRPMSPEQMAWSLLQAAGVVAGTRADIERQMTGVDPKFRDLVGLDAKRRRLGRRLVEQAVFDRLKGNAAPFVQQFGRAPGQSQDASDATVHQALFLANGQPVQSWLAGLAGRLAPMPDPSALAEELYLALLTRRPTAEERDEVARYLAGRGNERAKAVQELAWALVTSAEFRFNH